MHRGSGNARPRHAERMTKRDGAAMRIHMGSVFGNAKLAQDGNRLAREGFRIEGRRVVLGAPGGM